MKKTKLGNIMAVSGGESHDLLPTVNSTDGSPESQNLPMPDPPSYSEIPGTVPLSQGQGDENPPSYNDVVNSEVSPPTYQSLFGQITEARKNSSGFCDFLGKVITCLLQSILLTVFYAIPVVMIIIGIKYVGECPLLQFIPVYLIVGGTFGVIKNLLFCYSAGNKSENWLIHRILNWFLISWFIIGCIIIFNYENAEFDDEKNPLYCNKTLYAFMSWLICAPIVCFVFLMIICAIIPKRK